MEDDIGNSPKNSLDETEIRAGKDQVKSVRLAGKGLWIQTPQALPTQIRPSVSK